MDASNSSTDIREGVNTCDARLVLEIEHPDQLSLLHQGQTRSRSAGCAAVQAERDRRLHAKKRRRVGGALPEVVKRATFGISQLIETVAGEYLRSGLIMIGSSFDEFNRDVRVSYEGDMLKFPQRRPTNEQIRESDDGARLLAGFMLRRNADRVRSDTKDGRASVLSTSIVDCCGRWPAGREAQSCYDSFVRPSSREP
jgi:hypothetical protein